MEPQETRTLRAETPHGELALQLRGGARPGAALILDGAFLMDSDAAESERQLARRGLAAWKARRTGAPRISRGPAEAGCRVLVAGLGLGLSLRALLAEPGVARVTVVECFPEVVAWNRRELAVLNGGALADPRVAVHLGDLRGYLEAPARRDGERFDLLLLDIDNGPTWLSLPANAWLYGPEGFARLAAVTAPGGLAAYWATEPAEEFERRLAGGSGREGRGLLWWRERVAYGADGVPAGTRPEKWLESYLYLVAWER
jgi:spermidine synthase